MKTVTRVSERPPSFTDTLSAAAAGQYWAVDALAVICLPKLTAFAEGRGAIDPGGIANTVMMEFFGRLDSLTFDAPGQMWAYLYRIARSRVIDERRSTKPVDYLPDRTVEGLVSPTSDFDERVADRHYVDDLLSELTSDQREVIEMRFLDDLSIEETANRTGRTLTAIKALQRRAIRSLSAAVLLGVLVLIAGGLWNLLNGDDRVTTVSDVPAVSPPAPVLEVDTSGASVDGGAATIDSTNIDPGDYLAPTTVITGLVDGDDARSVTVEFDAEEASAGVERFECRLDDGEWTTCSSPAELSDLTDGGHLFEVRAVDWAGNVESTGPRRFWVQSVEQPEGVPAGVDVAALRRSSAVLKCAGISGTWVQLEEKGFDVMVGTDGDDVIDVSAGTKPDFVLGHDGNDTIVTGPGDDVVCAGGGNDTISTGAGADRIVGGGGNDTVKAGDDADRVSGGPGNDSIDGGGGQDALKGDAGFDLVEGGDGDDRLIGGDDVDMLLGGPGSDSCEAADLGVTADTGCETVP